MTLTRSSMIAIGASVLVLVIGVLMFATADQPFAEDGAAAQRWIDALCAEDIDTLYALSAAVVTLDRPAFEQQMRDYLRSGEVPFPCVGQVNFNLVRQIAVPTHLADSVDRAVQFSEARLQGADEFVAVIPLWAYHEIGGGWTIWAPVFGASRQGATASGELAHILDGNGLSVGSVQIQPPVQQVNMGGAVLIAIPVRFTTLSRVWEHYEGQLYVGQTAARRVERADDLPEEWRADFLPSVGDYLPQNFQRTGRLWFSVPAPDGTLATPVTLTMTAWAPYSGTIQSAFLNVAVDSLALVTPFDPFNSARFVEIAGDNPVFEVQIDTADMPTDQIKLECGRFTLVLVSDEWLRGTDCTFTEGLEQTLLRGERLTLRVTFAGYNQTDPAQFRALTYRRRDDSFVIRYDLWSPP